MTITLGMTVAEALAKALVENHRLNEQTRELQARGTELVEERRAAERALYWLRWGIVHNAGRTSTKRMPRWCHVRNATGLSSTSAQQLCIAGGVAPDEEIGGTEECSS